MPKTINFELSKKLKPLLENIETEYFYIKDGMDLFSYSEYGDDWRNTSQAFKTLTFEESIEFLKNNINPKNGYIDIWQAFSETGYNGGSLIKICFEFCNLEKIEKMLEYLLDNNKLCQTT